MQLKCIRHFSQYEPGDLVEVPDGAAFDDFHWEPVTGVPPVPAAPAKPEAASAAAPVQFPQPAPKEM